MPTGSEIHHRFAPVKIWLGCLAILVFAMVLVGGATRLTDSGLSITEWKPLLGAIPPLSAADWAEVFQIYQQTPEYQLQNSAMTLAEFKPIFWWEWGHRFLGRMIGLVFVIPFLFFWIRGYLTRALVMRLLGLLLLGGLQGGLGWFMVMSGLVDRVDVSQYRLAAHLTLATLIFLVILWTMWGIGHKSIPVRTGQQRFSIFIVILVLTQVACGGFVAGLDAGMGYQTWPLMDEKFIPDGLFVIAPWWRNLFDNALTVQFDHRMLAYVIFLCALTQAILVRNKSSIALAVLVIFQMLLGIMTLHSNVRLEVALSHQGGAMIVIATALYCVNRLLRHSPPSTPG